MDGSYLEDNSDHDDDPVKGAILDKVTTFDIPDEIISINVSGKFFQTYRTTLEKYPQSLLGDYERRNKYLNSETGELYFNRHRYAFGSILYYYQSDGVMEHPPELPLSILMGELKFFDIDETVIKQLQIDNGIRRKSNDIPSPNCTLFKPMWNFLEYPNSSTQALVFAVLSVIVILASLVMFVMATLPVFSDLKTKHTVLKDVSGGTNTTLFTHFHHKHRDWMSVVDTFIIIWFTTEFLLRVISCPNTLSFIVNFGNIIDFLSILPYYLSLLLSLGEHRHIGVIRVVRVLRVLRLARHSRGIHVLAKSLKASARELPMLALFLSISILTFGSLMYYAESGVPGTNFISIPHSLWWAIVSLTTTGYGDMVPETAVGRIIGSLAALVGLLMMALTVPIVVSNFLHYSIMEKKRELHEQARTAMLETKTRYKRIELKEESEI